MVTAPTRTLLLYAQDHKGLGHITRTLTIARHLLAAHPDAVAYVATESPITRDFVLPERCDYIKLPTRLTPRRASPTPGDSADDARFRRLRAELLRDVPLGHKGEFSDGLSALKAQRPGTKFVFGLRDIMDDIGRIRGQWRELGVYDALEQLYDGIAVYGQPDLFDVADAYAIPESVRPKLHYCGYVVRDLPTADATVVRRRYGLPEQGPLLAASVGSGSDGYPVLDAACTAVERLRQTFPDLVAVLVTGPFMPAGERTLLEARATPACRVVPEADTLELMAAADAILGMGGYNSVIEALAAARPLVIVPRATHKVEQQIRAETLAEQGLAQWVHPKDLNGDGDGGGGGGGSKLAAALEWARRRGAARALERERRLHRVWQTPRGALRARGDSRKGHLAPLRVARQVLRRGPRRAPGGERAAAARAGHRVRCAHRAGGPRRHRLSRARAAAAAHVRAGGARGLRYRAHDPSRGVGDGARTGRVARRPDRPRGNRASALARHRTCRSATQGR